MKQLLVTSSWDDGAISDLRLAKLLKKYNIPATFYIPLKNNERKVLSPKDIEKLSHDFEIGCHGLTHTSLTHLTNEEAAKEVLSSKKILEKIISKKITSFCYPQGKTNQTIKQLVGKAGFSYARTTSLFSTTIGEKLLAPTTVHAYNHNRLVYLKEGVGKKLEYSLLDSWDSLAMKALDYCIEHGGIFHLWGHSWEIDARNDWGRLEKVLVYINQRAPKNARVTNSQMITRTQKQKETYYKSTSPASVQKSYETAYYKKELAFIHNLVSLFDKKGQLVLDLGCGTGRVSQLFQKAEYVGVDFIKSFIAFAQKKWKRSNRKFLTAKFHQLPRKIAHRYNLLLIWGLFEDETDPFAQITRLEKYVSPKGRIIFTLHNVSNPFFRPLHFIKTEWMTNTFPYTSFSYRSLEKKVKEFAVAYDYSYDIKTFGLLPPAHKSIPALPGLHFGTTLCIILDKK